MSQLLIKQKVFSWTDTYDVYEQSRLVVHISKQLFKWGDTYVLDIANEADEIPALMVAIAMDAARCSEDDNRNSMI